jgi:tetratricopeptide (TPR) repeat protein/predicted Ser/Thr protein kinase
MCQPSATNAHETMTPDQHRRISELFVAACDLEAGSRAAFLDRECGEDVELRRRVETLLQLDPGSDASLMLICDGEDDPIDSDSTYPAKIAGFTIRRVLGRGGMGIVFLAEQEKPRRLVALKIIRTLAADDRALRRFEAEADILARLKHPCIVQVYEAGTADIDGAVCPYMAMEIVEDGVPITTHSADRGLCVADRLELIQKICDAVQHAHLRGVIHRDLKPANILVDASDQPKILDFGIARVATGAPDTQTRMTVAGQMLGTVAYMSPEQIEGSPDDVDARSDVHALGVVAYELLTGRLPYDLEGKTILQSARAVVEQPPIPAGRLDPTLRGDLEYILAKALAKDKTQRYQSARDLADDFGRFLRHEPIAARRGHVLYRTARFARRHRRGCATSGAAVIALSFSLIVWTVHAARQRANEVQLLVDEGVDLYKRGQFELADARLSQAYLLDQQDFEVLGNWAILKNAIVNQRVDAPTTLITEAIELCDRALELKSDHPNLWIIKGVLLKKVGRLDEAMQAWSRASDLAPTNSAAWSNLGMGHALLGDQERAKEYLRKAAQLPTQQCPACDCQELEYLAAVELATSDEHVDQTIDDAIECGPDRTMGLVLRARRRLQTGRPSDIGKARDDAVIADARGGAAQPRAERLRALALLRLGEFADAREFARAAADRGDLPVINQLIVAIAEGRTGNALAATTAVQTANKAWPDPLRKPHAILASGVRGVLWFDTADELFALKEEAEKAIREAENERTPAATPPSGG